MMNRIAPILRHFAAAHACALILTGAVLAADEPRRDPVIVVIGPNASSVENIAAKDLVSCLRQLYPGQQFELHAELPTSGRRILVGTVKTNPWLAAATYIDRGRISAPESFLVTVAPRGSDDMAVVAGADPRGCAYGVYALLEKLGCGFYLSYDALPEPKSQAFSFDGWELSDRPLAVERIVFNWHNFLSGCTGWNLADWQKGIAQSQKMRFNAIMVHAYGNNPMFAFSFRGKTKPVGYISSTVRGRDWGNPHVNDVRRLAGGSVFEGPIFGADTALAPEEQRAEAAQALMKQVFAEAARRAMHVYFTLDLDTAASNPEELIKTLPEGARFHSGTPDAPESYQYHRAQWLAAPDTPEGYEYYRTQVETLLRLYPQIDRLVLFVRPKSTPWTELAVARWPARWRDEFQSRVLKEPGLGALPNASAWFALSKVIAAYQRSLREVGRGDVRLMLSGFYFDWAPSAALGRPVLPARGILPVSRRLSRRS